MDASNRLSIPVNVLRAVEWWEGKPAEVLAESVHEGLIRLYLAREAAPLVEALIEELAELPATVRFERAAIFADRYRPLKLYGDGRTPVHQGNHAGVGLRFGRASYIVRTILSKRFGDFELAF